jgi:hypothetical protein
MYAPGTVQNSNLDTIAMLLAIGTSKNNALRGFSENWPITTHTNDNICDTGTANKTFAPGIANGAHGWTTVGAITQRAKYLLSGNTARFQIVLSAATSVACTSGATIPTLPYTASDIAMGSVTDYTTGASLGIALIAGNTITLPTAITTTADTIIISGTYFFS